MISQIKYSLNQIEIEYLTNLINLPNKFSYELAHIIYSKDYIEFLSNCEDFICVLFYKNDEDKDEDNLQKIEGFILGHVNLLYVQNANNKLINKLSMYKEHKKFDYTPCLFIDFIYTSDDLSVKDIMYNLSFFGNGNCIYKLDKDISYSTFIKKYYYYYRPININLLKNLNILNEEIVTDTFTKVYNTFTYPIDFNKNKIIKLNEKLSNDEFEMIFYKLIEYNFINFEISHEINYNNLKNICDSDLFYKFFIYDDITNELTDFVCFKKFKFYNSDTQLLCDNAHFLMGFFDSYNSQYMYDINEYICMFAHRNNLFDIMTITDNLYSSSINKKKLNTKFLKSIKKEYYYDENIDLCKLKHEYINFDI